MRSFRPSSSCSGSSKFLGRADLSICAHADTRTSFLVDGCAPLYSQRDGRETDISTIGQHWHLQTALTPGCRITYLMDGRGWEVWWPRISWHRHHRAALRRLPDLPSIPRRLGARRT